MLSGSLGQARPRGLNYKHRNTGKIPENRINRTSETNCFGTLSEKPLFKYALTNGSKLFQYYSTFTIFRTINLSIYQYGCFWSISETQD